MAKIGQVICEVFTETEISLIIDAVNHVHYPGKSREMASCPAAVICKMRTALEIIEKRRLSNAAFAESLTDEERDLIIIRRRQETP